MGFTEIDALDQFAADCELRADKAETAREREYFRERAERYRDMQLRILCGEEKVYTHANALQEGPNVSHTEKPLGLFIGVRNAILITSGVLGLVWVVAKVLALVL